MTRLLIILAFLAGTTTAFSQKRQYTYSPFKSVQPYFTQESFRSFKPHVGSKATYTKEVIAMMNYFEGKIRDLENRLDESEAANEAALLSSASDEKMYDVDVTAYNKSEVGVAEAFATIAVILNSADLDKVDDVNFAGGVSDSWYELVNRMAARIKVIGANTEIP